MLIPWLVRSKPMRIAVVGDLMLDEYWDGAVSRISPEAPVPVHLVQSTEANPGGAGNTARNIAKSGGVASLFSVWGEDEAAKLLASLLAADFVDTQGVISDPSHTTVRKTRVRAASQQVLRIDWEKYTPLSPTHQDELLRRLQASTFDGLVISDYGKGALPAALLERIFALCRQRQVLSIVDPKGRDFRRYQGCHLVTPNLKEACEALDLDPLLPAHHDGIKLGRALQQSYGLQDVLVTMGAQGMVYVPRHADQAPVSRAPRAREVFDVSGAGDTVVAILSLGLVAGASVEAAVDLANLAAGIVVEKRGTQPVTLQEILQAVSPLAQGGEGAHAALEDPADRSALRGRKSKIFARQDLVRKLATMRSAGKKVVFTNGCFDILHMGHVTYLEEARRNGDLLIVGVNADASVRRLKGADRPVNNAQARLEVLAALEAVDFVVEFNEDTPARLIEELAPDILVKGADYEESAIVGAEFVKKRGGKVLRIPFVEGYSTTYLLSKRSRDEGS